MMVYRSSKNFLFFSLLNFCPLIIGVLVNLLVDFFALDSTTYMRSLGGAPFVSFCSTAIVFIPIFYLLIKSRFFYCPLCIMTGVYSMFAACFLSKLKPKDLICGDNGLSQIAVAQLLMIVVGILILLSWDFVHRPRGFLMDRVGMMRRERAQEKATGR